MSLAICVIASDKRKETTFGRCMDRLTAIGAGEKAAGRPVPEIVAVADFTHPYAQWRHLVVSPLTRTTVDALVKRDVGWITTTAPSICYLCDDHILAPDFASIFADRYAALQWDVLVPSRFVMRGGERVDLNVGRDLHYAGGHCAIYRRECGQRLPWSATQHHPNWDVIHSHQLLAAGFRIRYADTDLSVEDIEPGATPWI